MPCSLRIILVGLLIWYNINNYRTVVKSLFRICVVKRRYTWILSKSINFNIHIAGAGFLQCFEKDAPHILCTFLGQL